MVWQVLQLHFMLHVIFGWYFSINIKYLRDHTFLFYCYLLWLHQSTTQGKAQFDQRTFLCANFSDQNLLPYSCYLLWLQQSTTQGKAQFDQRTFLSANFSDQNLLPYSCQWQGSLSKNIKILTQNLTAYYLSKNEVRITS